MRKALIAGVAYFAAVFTLGFLLGTVRVLVAAPRLGELGAVLLELPVMLTASWLICGVLMGRFEIGARGTRAVMSAVALVLLVIAEPVGAMLLFGRTPGDLFESYRTPVAILGLVSQIAFVLFPLFRPRSAPMQPRSPRP